MLTHPALMVVDEIGYLPVSREGAVLFFQGAGFLWSLLAGGVDVDPPPLWGGASCAGGRGAPSGGP